MFLICAVAGAQTPIAADSTSLSLVTGETVARARDNQLWIGVPSGGSLLLRSASSITPHLASGRRTFGFAVLDPQFLFVDNSAIPFSENNGALWAGRGLSTRSLLGFRLESRRVHLIVAPELIASANSDWTLLHDFYVPPLPPGRSKYDLPYYVGRFTIDQPLRFGDKRIRRVDPGESTLSVSGERFEFGASNENEWWGPGLRNAIVLSNNAPGFPHLFLRTTRPLNTRFGGVEMRWLVGGLSESRYFDTVSTNNKRSLSALAFTLQTRWDPNLSVGVARTVYETAHDWGQVPWRWLDVFARTSPSENHIGDSTRTLRDHFYSLFGRWVFPASGLELNAEWARIRFPLSLKEFLIAPNRTQGYTIGLQWLSRPAVSGAVRFQAEITQLEESAAYRDGPVDSWYTSTRVIQGYTNRGEMLGAFIGPGASSQWLAADYVKPTWRVGVFGTRIRWNQDVHNNAGLPIYVGYCSEDVTISPGLRAAKSGTLGSITADLSFQNRLTPFFQNGGGCPNNGRRLDIRNQSLSVTFVPFRR